MTMSFGNPVLVRNYGRHLVVTQEPLTYRTITVPAGFASDGTSRPWVLGWIFPRFGVFINASILHDYLYWSQPLARYIADADFNEAMRFLDVPTYRRKLMYKGVRMFGWISWHRNKKSKAAGKFRVFDLEETPFPDKKVIRSMF